MRFCCYTDNSRRHRRSVINGLLIWVPGLKAELCDYLIGHVSRFLFLRRVMTIVRLSVDHAWEACRAASDQERQIKPNGGVFL